MANLPKVVRDRLAGAPGAASSHPDPDLLTAFVEGGISGRERDGVLRHLATCAECREVVSLATPELVAHGPLTASPASRKIWSVPMLRWAAVSATVVVVLAVGLMVRPFRTYNDARAVSDKAAAAPAPETRRDMTALSSSATASSDKNQVADYFAAASREAKPDKTLAAKQAPAGDRDKLRAIQENKGERRTASATPPANDMVIADNKAFTGRYEAAARAKSAAPSSPLPAGPAQAPMGGPVARAAGAGTGVTSRSESAATNAGTLDVESSQVETSAEKVKMQTTQLKAGNEGQKKDEQTLAKEGTTNAPAQPDLANSVQAAPSQVAASKAGGGAGGIVAGRPAAELMATPTSIPQAKMPPVRWTIDAAGNLQRSNDLGKTWQLVSVADGAHLQALAVVQNNVWAGGSGGALYHSSDGGGQWTRVRPSVADITLTDDIIRIGVRDAQHVTVTTSSSEIWSSADGGQTWRKSSR